MNILFWSLITTQITLLELFLKIVNVHSLTVMSVDLGSEWMKVATVSVSINANYNIAKHKTNICIFTNIFLNVLNLYSLTFQEK